MVARFQKVASAYAIASLSIVPVGYIGTRVLQWGFEGAPDFGITTGALWLVTVGGPSIAWARQNLARQLGIRQAVTVRGIGARGVPILGDVTRMIGAIKPPPPPNGNQEFYIAHQIELKRGPYRVREPELNNFLTICWNRQHASQPPFSRTYWVERRPHRMRRHKYNVIMDVLTVHDLIEGRTQGGSGYLIGTPGMVLANLRHWYG